MKKEKGKQIILLVSAICLIVVGYLNYDYSENEFIEVAADVNDINVGDVQLVNSEPVENNQNISEKSSSIETGIVPNDSENIIEESKDDYFTITRLERDAMYSEMIETYQKIVDSQEISADQKAIATQEISNITNIKNGTMISENLIKNKGFEEVVILVNNNIVSVVVKSSNLNSEQVAKIQNIVARELNAVIENINISSK